MQVDTILQRLHKHRWIVGGTAALVAILVVTIWFLRLAASPSRYSGDSLWLSAYGISGVELKIVYPTRLSIRQTEENAATITVLARARSAEDIQPLELIFPLQDEAVAFVDLSGVHVPGRLTILPGYPDALPYDLRVAHGNTQQQGYFLRPYRVDILPMMRQDGETVALPELAFRIRLEGHWEHAIRAFAVVITSVGVPYMLLAVVAVIASWVWWRGNRQRSLAREKRLATVYGRLREHIVLEHWQDARRDVEQVRLLQPRYRDVDQLDTLVSSAETAAWRREQLYRAGVQAYKDRDWPSAVQAFSTIEKETPFYRDVRFLRRTGELYVDLTSRDRSRRIAAAQQLGEIGDLLDVAPLLHSLGDRSESVADAAEDSFRSIGLGAFDVLLGGLAQESPEVRRRAYGLLEGMGQSVREQLPGVLRSSDPRITAPVARLLATLGARKELAQALLWATEEHQEGIVAALVGEGVASSSVLIEVLLEAPPERQQLILNALAALKSKADIDRHIEQTLRAAKDPAMKELLQRALRMPATTFRVARAGVSPAKSLPSQEAARRIPSGQASSPRRL